MQFLKHYLTSGSRLSWKLEANHILVKFLFEWCKLHSLYLCYVVQTCIPGLYMIGYWTRKIIFEIPAFFMFEQGKSRAGKFKPMLNYSINIFYFEFPTLDFPRSNIKKVGISKYFFLIQYPIIYNPATYHKGKVYSCLKFE